MSFRIERVVQMVFKKHKASKDSGLYSRVLINTALIRFSIIQNLILDRMLK